MFTSKVLPALLTGAILLATPPLLRADHSKAPAVEVDRVRTATHALAVEVTHLVEDIEVDLRHSPGYEQLLGDARRVVKKAGHLSASIAPDAELDHILKDYQQFDEAWHHLGEQLEAVRSLTRHVERAVQQVEQIDRSLHLLLGIPSPVSQEKVSAVAARLAKDAEHLLADVRQDLGSSARFAPIVQAAEHFAEAAEHLHRSVEEGAGAEHARKDFSEVAQAWRQLVSRVHYLSRLRFGHVHDAAGRIAPTVAQLQGALGILPRPETVGLAPFGTGRLPYSVRAIEDTYFDLSYDPLHHGPFVPRYHGYPVYDPYLFEFRPEEPDYFLRHRQQRVPLKRFDSTAPLHGGKHSGPHDHSQHEHSVSNGHTHSHTPAFPAPANSRQRARAAKPQDVPPPEPDLDQFVLKSLAKLSPKDRRAALAQRVCPVTEDILGSLGEPVKVRVQGRDVFVCCNGCVRDLRKEPEKYLRNLSR